MEYVLCMYTGVRLQPFKGDHTVLSKLLVVDVIEGSLADRHGNQITTMQYIHL